MRVCEALAVALVDDPFYRAVSVAAADEAARHRMLTDYFALAYLESAGAGEVQLSAPDGAAFWNTPEVPSAVAQQCALARKDGMQQLLGARGFGNYREICEGMAQQVPAHLAGAWYLSILGVRPAARGKGLAGQLLQPTLRRVDQAGALSYLETFNPLSLPFYRQHGYVHEVRCFEPVTQRDYWLMVREPRAGRWIRDRAEA